MEIVGGRATAPETLVWVETFYRRIGKTPLVCQSESIGHIGNRLQEAIFREALHMIDAGEATVEQIDAAITHGPGLRWSFMGPVLSYHLAGGLAGIRGFFERFGASLSEPYSRLHAPELTKALLTQIVTQTEKAYGELAVEDFEAWRDERLQAVLSALQSREPPTSSQRQHDASKVHVR